MKLYAGMITGIFIGLLWASIAVEIDGYTWQLVKKG